MCFGGDKRRWKIVRKRCPPFFYTVTFEVFLLGLAAGRGLVQDREGAGPVSFPSLQNTQDDQLRNRELSLWPWFRLVDLVALGGGNTIKAECVEWRELLTSTGKQKG